MAEPDDFKTLVARCFNQDYVWGYSKSQSKAVKYLVAYCTAKRIPREAVVETFRSIVNESVKDFNQRSIIMLREIPGIRRLLPEVLPIGDMERFNYGEDDY